VVLNANGVLSSSPGLRGTSYPGNEIDAKPTPTGLWPERHRGATPLGLGRFWISSQGSRSCFAPTLGWRTKRRWRCSFPQLVIETSCTTFNHTQAAMRDVPRVSVAAGPAYLPQRQAFPWENPKTDTLNANRLHVVDGCLFAIDDCLHAVRGCLLAIDDSLQWFMVFYL